MLMWMLTMICIMYTLMSVCILVELLKCMFVGIFQQPIPSIHLQQHPITNRVESEDVFPLEESK